MKHLLKCHEMIKDDIIRGQNCYLYDINDKKYVDFADRFEARYVSQDYYENRPIEETLDLGWELLSMFEHSELKRIDIKLIDKYMPKFSKEKESK